MVRFGLGRGRATGEPEYRTLRHAVPGAADAVFRPGSARSWSGNMTSGMGLPELPGQIIELLRMRGVDKRRRAR